MSKMNYLTMVLPKVVNYFMYAMTSIHFNLVSLVWQVVQFMAYLGLIHWITINHIFYYIQAMKDMGIIYGGEGSKWDALIDSRMDHQLWSSKRLRLWQESFKSNINTPNTKIEITTPKHGIYNWLQLHDSIIQMTTL